MKPEDARRSVAWHRSVELVSESGSPIEHRSTPRVANPKPTRRTNNVAKPTTTAHPSRRTTSAEANDLIERTSSPIPSFVRAPISTRNIRRDKRTHRTDDVANQTVRPRTHFDQTHPPKPTSLPNHRLLDRAPIRPRKYPTERPA